MLKWSFLPLILLGVYAIVLLARFFTPADSYLAYFEDDFFFYLVIAKNLVLHGVPTFDQVRQTNGYQPLWQLVNTVLYRVFGDHRAFFIAFVVLIFLLVCGTYRVLRQTQARLGISGGYGLACAMLSITFMAAISRTGMEISLALFLLVLFWKRMAAAPLEEQAPAAALLSGLLASAVILARLDAMLAIAAYGVLTLLRPATKRPALVRALVFFSIGLVPVIVYFIWNHATYGTVLPISGVAKNLKRVWYPSSSTLISLVRVRAANMLLTWPACFFGLLFALHRIRAPRETEEANLGGQRVQLCVLLHPVLFYTVLSFTSDWKIWSWYLYPLVPLAALLGPTALSDWKFLRSQTVTARLTFAATIVSILTLAPMAISNQTERQLYQQAKELNEFSKSHPGRYAMGGGSGGPGYVMDSSLVQLEGLMGDRPFLEHIRKNQPLVQALQEMQVDYYATMLLRGPQPGPCFHLREPEMAGPNSPVMAGNLCGPVADFANPSGGHLVVFDVHRLAAAEVNPK